MKSFVFGLLAVAGIALSTCSASAQYVVVPHRNHAHVVPVYQQPVVQYYQPTVVSDFGSSYSYSGYQPSFVQPRVSFGVTFGSPSFGGGFGSPSFGGFGGGYQNFGHHHHHHHGHR